MKPRRWILALMLVPALLILGFLAAWRLFGLEQRLRGEVVELLEASGLERVELEAVHPAWLGLDLRGLGFTRQGGGLRLESRDVRLRLAPLVWLKSPTRALKAVQRVELQSFTLMLDDSLLRRDSQAESSRLKDVLRALSPTLASLPEVRLGEGTILWRRASGEDLSLVDGLDGQIFRQGEELDLLLRSQVLDNRHQAFHADMQLNASTLDGHFSLSLDSLSQNLSDPEWWALLKRAELGLDLELEGWLGAGEVERLKGEGELRLRRVELEHAVGPVRGTLPLVLDEDSVRVNAAVLSLDGQGARLSAAFPWKLEGARLDLHGQDWELGPLAEAYARLTQRPLPALDGLMSVDVEALWRGGPQVQAALDLSQLVADGKALGDASGVLDWRAGVANLRDLVWRPMAGLEVGGEARLRGAGGSMALASDLRVEAQSDLVPALRGRLAKGSAALLDVALGLHQVRQGWEVDQGSVDGILQGPDGPLLSISGELQGGQRLAGDLPACKVQLRTPEGRSLGSAEWLDSATRSWQASLNLLPRPLEQLFDLAPTILPDDLTGEIHLQGVQQRTEALAQLDWRGRRVTLDGLLGWTDSLRSIRAALTVEGWRGRQVQGQLEADLAGSRLELSRLQLEGLELGGWLDLESRLCQVDATVEDQALEPFWDLLYAQAPPGSLGRLSMLAGGEGRLDELGLRGGIEWRDQVRGRRALVRADLAVDPRQATLERGAMSLDGETWASFNMQWAMRSGPRQLELELLGRDLATLLPAPAKGQAWLQGALKGHLNVELASTGGRSLEGHLHVASPRVGPLTFESLDLGISQGSSEGTLSLDSLVLQRGGATPLRLQASGLLATGNGDSDVELRLSGDLLQPLTLTLDGRRSTFFRQAKGQGEINLHLVGNLLEPQIRDGRVELANGSLDMASVFRRVRNLQLVGVIENGRLQLETGLAQIGDTRLRISNSWDAVVDGQALDAWVFENPELDCGVIELATLDAQGREAPVELTIPGLMEPDWSGRVTLKGAGQGERFWFAGPLERPVVRGLAQVDNAQFTYPFIKGEEAPTPLLRAVIDFLNRMQWDLAIQAGRNVNYWKKVQGFDDTRFVDRLKGYLDRITVDVFVEPMLQPLWMRGQIEDESFRIQGEAYSRKGSVIFLDKEFDVEEAGLIFDPTSLMPMVWGRAVHTLLATEQDPGLQSMFSQDARQIWLQLCTTDELGNRQARGRWDEIRVELMDDLNGSQDLLGKGQEELLVDMGINPYDATGSIESMLPDVVAGFWEIPLRPIESRIRRQLGLDQVRIFLPVLRNTVEELLSTQTTQEQISQSYLDYLQGTRVILGKSLGPRTFASWTGQLVATHPVEGQAVVGLFQRCNLDYQVSRNLNLTGELVFDPLRDAGLTKGDPRLLLRYRQNY